MAHTTEHGDGVPERLAEHVVDSSEPEEPEDTLERLYGEHDGADAKRALELVGDLVDDDGSTTVAGDPDGDPRHEIDFGDSVEPAACADGALFAAEAAPVETVTVSSTDPVRDETVRFERDADGWSVHPAAAVVSLGMAADVAEDEDLLTAGVAFTEGGCVDDRAEAVLCRNFTAFVDVDAYEAWAAASDAVSVAVPAVVFAELLCDLAETIGFE